jgi:hypothetical protein
MLKDPYTATGFDLLCISFLRLALECCNSNEYLDDDSHMVSKSEFPGDKILHDLESYSQMEYVSPFLICHA